SLTRFVRIGPIWASPPSSLGQPLSRSPRPPAGAPKCGTVRDSVSSDNRHRGLRKSLGTPATPPGMRVRTGRFEELRSRGEPGDPQLVEVADGKGHVDEHPGVSPPAPAIGRHPPGSCFRETSAAQFPVDGSTPFPVLEVDGPEAVPDPFVEVAEDARRVGEPEVRLPADEVAAQVPRDLFDAPSPGPLRNDADTLLHRGEGLAGNPTFHYPPRRHPERVAQELAVPRQIHRTLRLVD